MKMKKLLSMVTAVVLSVTISAEVFAVDAPGSNGNSQTSISNEMQVTGTNSFGNMLAQEINAKENEQLENNGYNVFSVEVTGQTAEVELQTLKNSTVVVGVYTEDGSTLLQTANAAVTPDDETVKVTFAQTLPEYFYIKAYLINSENMRPLCTVYECPNYTKEMQEFFKKTTADFPADRVLNLDNDTTNNFAVYGDDVKVIPRKSGVNTLVSSGNGRYVFGNADENLTSLAAGDIFAYKYDDENVIIAAVKTISEKDGTVTITEAEDASMEDVFDYLKIDVEASMEDVTVDTSGLDEGVVYEGLVTNEESENQAKGIATVALAEDDIKQKHSAKFAFLDKKIETENVKVSLSGEIGLALTPSLKYYIDLDYQYIELSIELEAKVELSLTGEVTGKIPLGDFSYKGIPGLSIGIKPSIVLELSVAYTVDGTVTGSIGVRAEHNKGSQVKIENISKKFEFDAELKVEGTIFVGFSLEPNIEVIDDNIAEMKFTAKTGVEIKGTLPILTTDKDENDGDKEHLCRACIDGEVSWKFTISFSASLLKLPELTFKIDLLDKKVPLPALDFYYSVDYNDFGLGECPHNKYKVTLLVFTESYSPVANAQITISSLTSKQELVTDEKGSAVVMLEDNTYEVFVTGEGYKRVKKGITVDGKPTSLVVTLKPDTESGNTKPDTGNNGNIGFVPVPSADNNSDIVNSNTPTITQGVKQVSLGYDHSAAITVNGDLYTWGLNSTGELGDGTTKSSSVPKKVMSDVASVSLGRWYSAVITTNGDLYTWGDNRWGQLGDGTSDDDDHPHPKKIMSNVASVSLGWDHSAAITTNGDLYTWGMNHHSQLGNGTYTEYSVANPTPQKIMSNVASVSLGNGFSAAITTNGDLYTWGCRYDGQLGYGAKNYNNRVPNKIMSNVASVSLGGEFSAAITTNGDLYIWGDAYLGDGTTKSSSVPKKIMSNVVSVSLGCNHSAAITTNGDLYTWGVNESGELGDGKGGYQKVGLTPNKIMSNVASVSLGTWHSAAITTNGDLYTWGNNYNGRLGNGTVDDYYNVNPTPIKIDIPPKNYTIKFTSKENVQLPQNITVQYGTFVTLPNVPTKTGYDGKWILEGKEITSVTVESDIVIEAVYTKRNETISIASDELTITTEVLQTDSADIMPIAETTDPNISTDHPQAPAPTPDVYPETAQHFSGLLANEIYYCYGMKSKTAANPFDSGNLLFIAQAVSDGSGNLDFTYQPVDDYPNAEVFVKSMTDFEVTNAEITDITENKGIVTVSWNAVPNANKYKVYKVMNGVYIEAGETSGNSCTLSDIIPNYNYKLVVTSCVHGEWSTPSDENAVFFMLTEKQEAFTKGDVNADGKIDILDLATMRRHLAGNPTEIDEQAADLDGNGDITILDLAILRRYLAGNEEVLS